MYLVYGYNKSASRGTDHRSSSQNLPLDEEYKRKLSNVYVVNEKECGFLIHILKEINEKYHNEIKSIEEKRDGELRKYIDLALFSLQQEEKEKKSKYVEKLRRAEKDAEGEELLCYKEFVTVDLP